MVKKTKEPTKLNKPELEALNSSEMKIYINKLKNLFQGKEKKLKIEKLLEKKKKFDKKKKDIDRTEEYFDFKSGKKDEGYKVMEAAKGGMVKKYMGGGSVHKNKNKMLTTKGWGASRKT